MPTYAQVEDVEKAWGQSIPSTRIEHVEGLIEEAETQLELDPRIGVIDERIEAGTTTAPRVKLAVVEMVLRVLRNPGGYRQQTAGPFSYTVDRSVASGRMAVTARERRLLGARAGASSVSLSAGDVAFLPPSYAGGEPLP